MTPPSYTRVFDPQLWVHIERILSRVPHHIDLGSCRTGDDFVETLGMNGAKDALRAYLAALESYYAGTVLFALRAATMRPMSPPHRGGFGEAPFDDALWARMFDMTWKERREREGGRVRSRRRDRRSHRR